MARFELWFTIDSRVSLDKTSFSHPLLEGEQRALRGKTAGVYPNYSTFQWTAAVRAMAIMAVRAAAQAAASNRDVQSESPILQGGAGSAAASLDYCLGKLPLWLLDMFGVDRNGNALSKRIFTRSNPERRRPGPVAISINHHALAYHFIEIYINNEHVEGAALFALANRLAAEFDQERQLLPRRPKLIEKLEKKWDSIPQQTRPNPGFACPCCGVQLNLHVGERAQISSSDDDLIAASGRR